MAEWVRASRLNGVFRYQLKNIGRLLTWAFLVVLITQILSLLMPYIAGNQYPFEGIRGNFEIVFFAAFILGIITAGRGTRFLLRFGTSRTSVWLGNIAGLLAGMVALLLATFLLNMLVAAALFPLSSLTPKGFSMSADLYRYELGEGLKNLPTLILYTLEWTSIFYLYGCVLRRFKILTISFSIGIPLLFTILMLIPAVREALSVIEGNDRGQLVIFGLKWIQILQDIVVFIRTHWDTIQLTAGIVSLPVSYLIMRGTKQP